VLSVKHDKEDKYNPTVYKIIDLLLYRKLCC